LISVPAVAHGGTEEEPKRCFTTSRPSLMEIGSSVGAKGRSNSKGGEERRVCAWRRKRVAIATASVEQRGRSAAGHALLLLGGESEREEGVATRDSSRGN